MLIYLAIGVLWAWWLEYYTTKHLEGILSSKWTWPERFIHIILWPATLGFFLITLFKNK